MKEYTVNREKEDLKKFMKTKAEKQNLQCIFDGDKVVVESKPGQDKSTQTPIPVCFRGELLSGGEETRIIGKYSYGFYLTTLVIVAAILILARFIWSAYQRQVDNMVLCGIVTALLVAVCFVTRIKGQELKEKINTFLGDLNKR